MVLSASAAPITSPFDERGVRGFGHPRGRRSSRGLRRQQRRTDRLERLVERRGAGRRDRRGIARHTVVDDLGQDCAKGHQIARTGMTQIGITAREVPRARAFQLRVLTVTRETEVDDVHPTLDIDDEIVRLDVAMRETQRRAGRRVPRRRRAPP